MCLYICHFILSFGCRRSGRLTHVIFSLSPPFPSLKKIQNNRSKGLIPTWGPDDSFHLNPMLLQNMIKSQYFQKCCRDITDWTSLVDEIYYQVTHLEPWAVGSTRDPSTAFCLLLRLFTLRCTEKQMKLLLDHADSPYIRGIGFLYLRYVCDPKVVWDWIEPYLYDEEPIKASAQSSKQSTSEETVGSYVRRIFTDRNYSGTMLPRLPIQIEREIQVKLLQAEKIEDRAQKHTSNPQTMRHFERLGSKVMALYGDDDNPIQWYDAVVDRVLHTDEVSGLPLKRKRFIVTFPEYGNTETVTLGELEMPGMVTAGVVIEQPKVPASAPQRGGGYDDDRGYDRGGDHRNNHNNRRNDGRGYEDNSRGYGSIGRGRGYDRNDRGYEHGGRGIDRDRGSDDRERGRLSNDRWERGYDGGGGRAAAALPTEDALYEEVRRREREGVTANNRSGVSRRPPTMKSQLSGSGGRGSRRYSESPERGYSPTSRRHHPQQSSSRHDHGKNDAPPPREEKKRSAEELAAIREKKRKLMAKYG